MLNSSQQCTLLSWKLVPYWAVQQEITSSWSEEILPLCLFEIVCETLDSKREMSAEQREPSRGREGMIREGKEADKIWGEGEEMGACPPWSGGSPCGSLTAHLHCQQGADRGNRPCHCVEGGTLLAILCYLALTDWSIGEMRGAKMFNPSNAIFLSTERPLWNERKKKKKNPRN